MKRPGFWVGIFVSAASLVVILLLIDAAAIVDALKNANYGLVALSTGGVFIFMILRAMRWRFMLSNDVSLNSVFHIQNIGYMLTNLLPFRAGDVARAVLIGSVPPVTIARGISTMVVERILDMMFMVALLPLTLVSLEGLPGWMSSAARISGILVVGVMAILVAAANKRQVAESIARAILERIHFLDTERWVQRTKDMLLGLSSLSGTRDSLIVVLLSIAVWLPIIFAYYVMLLAVNIQPTWAMAAFVVCAAAFSIAAPSSPGQIGVFHAGVIAALSFLEQPEAESAGFAFIYHALALIMMILLGLVGLANTGTTFGQVLASVRGYGNQQEVTEG